MRCVLVPPELDRSLEKQIVFIVVPVVRKAYHIIILALFLEAVAIPALKFSLNINSALAKNGKFYRLKFTRAARPCLLRSRR